jgi:hypothetical protein
MANALSALHHWHDLNGQQWHGSDPFVHKIRRAAVTCLPPSSSLSMRTPVIPQHLIALRENLDFTNTFDSAVFAVATCAFWGVCRLGEITVPSISAFDPAIHVTRSCDLSFSPRGSSNPQSAKFRLPWTKTERSSGAIVSLTAIPGPSCPIVALQHHLLSNSDLPSSAPFFAFKTSTGFLPMVKKSFLDRCSDIFCSVGLAAIHGHSFRIGGATEHLRRGLSVELLKIQGRWKSDAFQRYIRRTDEILSMNIIDLDVRERLRMDSGSA